MRTIHAALLALFLAASLSAPACKTGPDVLPTSGEVKECGAQLATSRAFDFLPRVNTVLAQGGVWESIEKALLQLAADSSLEMISCLVQRIGSDAAASAQASPDDRISGLKAERAQRWLVSYPVPAATP